MRMTLHGLRPRSFCHDRFIGALAVGTCAIGKGRRRDMDETGKIAAILAADIVEYNCQTGTDEGGTLPRLRALRAKRSQ